MADQPNANEGDTSQATGAAEALNRDDVSKLVNQAITGHLKRHTESFTKSLDERFNALLERFPAPAQAPAQPGQTAAARTPEENAQAQKLADAMKQIEALTKHNAQVAAEARDTKLRQAVAEELAAIGLGPDRVKHALRFLVDGEKLISHDDENQDRIVFRDTSTGQSFPLKDGLTRWAKTPDAKIYLPPVGAAGSGSGAPTGGNRAGPQGPTMRDLGIAIGEAAGFHI